METDIGLMLKRVLFTEGLVDFWKDQQMPKKTYFQNEP
jgi:hypothetical protein